MMTLKIHYDNGDAITTCFNGTVDDAVKYYIDKKHVFNYGEREEMAIGRAIEFLSGGDFRQRGGRYETLKRIYSISPAYMERYGLINKIRQTWSVEDENHFHGFAGAAYTDDSAFIAY